MGKKLCESQQMMWHSEMRTFATNLGELCRLFPYLGSQISFIHLTETTDGWSSYSIKVIILLSLSAELEW